MKGEDKLRAILTDLGGKELARASAQVVNRLAAKAITRSLRRVAREKRLPVRRLKRRVRLTQAKANTEWPQARIRVYRGDFPAINLGTARILGIPGRRGSVLHVGHHSLPGAFIQYLKTGRWQVLHRDGRARMPIHVVKIPVKEALTTAFREETQRLWQDNLPQALQQAMARQLQLLLRRQR
ncbi:phage tail protein [Edwardsiella tarda]|uniref:phage tail protein n=1 Tax=Edwardsiella tarda TaxID=636 RepID=UPI00351BFEFB